MKTALILTLALWSGPAAAAEACATVSGMSFGPWQTPAM